MVLPMLLGYITVHLSALVVVLPVDLVGLLLEARVCRIAAVLTVELCLRLSLLAVEAVHGFVVFIVEMGMLFAMRARAIRRVIGFRIRFVETAEIWERTPIRAGIATIIGGRRVIIIAVHRCTASSEEHSAQRHDPEKRTSIHRMLLLEG